MSWFSIVRQFHSLYKLLAGIFVHWKCLIACTVPEKRVLYVWGIVYRLTSLPEAKVEGKGDCDCPESSTKAGAEADVS